MRKYLIPFRSHDNTEWRIDIENDAYTGAYKIVKGVSESAAILNYDPDAVDDPFSTLIKSTIDISVYNEGQMDLNELQQAQDRDWKVKLYRVGILYWSGFLTTESIQYPLLTVPNSIQLSAICGLSMLDAMPYVPADLPGTTSAISRCPMNYFRQILFGNLGITLPIRWTNSLQCTAYIAQDVFIGSVEWSVNNEGFYSYQSGADGESQGPINSCGYILTGLLQAFQCRIFQAEGKWVIRRINDYVTGTFTYRQIGADLGPMTVSVGNENVLKQIGRSGYPFTAEDQLITSQQGLKTSRVTYNANVRQNILPNGSQDISIGGSPLYWGFYDIAFNGALSVAALDGRAGGFATQISHVYTGENDHNAFFTLLSTGGTLDNDGLPIDTLTMIKYINFGFLFSPNTGFPVDGDGNIIWTDNPLRIRLVFNAGATKYYLNEFGFWQTDATDIPIVIDGLQLDDIAQVDFNKFQNIIMPTPDAQPGAGDTSDIVIDFILQGTQQYVVDNIYINIDSGNDVYEVTNDTSKNTTVDDRSLNISSSFGGYQLSNLMTNWSRSDSECFYREGLSYEVTLSLMTAHSIMKFRYKSSKIYNGTMKVTNALWSFDHIYFIDSFATSKFMGMSAKYNIEKNEVFLVAIESRSDNIIFTEKYYNSNDNQLSN